MYLNYTWPSTDLQFITDFEVCLWKMSFEPFLLIMKRAPDIFRTLISIYNTNKLLLAHVSQRSFPSQVSCSQAWGRSPLRVYGLCHFPRQLRGQTCSGNFNFRGTPGLDYSKRLCTINAVLWMYVMQGERSLTAHGRKIVLKYDSGCQNENFRLNK